MRCTGLRRDHFQTASGERSFRRGWIPVHQTHIPSCKSYNAVRIDISGNAFQRGLDGRRASLPEKFHVTALNLYIDGVRREREHAIEAAQRILPVAQAEIGLRRIVERSRIARINCFGLFVSGDGLRQMSLPALDGRDEETDIAIIWQYPCREIEFTQRFIVVRFFIVKVQSQSEMSFAEISFESQRHFRFSSRFLL